MRYLLDTHIWLRSLTEPDKLDKNTVQVLENKGNELDVFGNKKASRKGRRGRKGGKRESVRSAIFGGFALFASFAGPILIK